MAKRKRKHGDRPGFQFKLSKDYSIDIYVRYLMSAETGLFQAGTINADLTDGDVDQALTDLMAQLQEPDVFLKLFSPKIEPSNQLDMVDKNENEFVQTFVLMNLRETFARYGRLEAEDVIGILDVVKTSVKRWSVGMHRRGYLTYIKGFLGQMGVTVRQATPEEAENLKLSNPDQNKKGDE